MLGREYEGFLENADKYKWEKLTEKVWEQLVEESVASMGGK